MLEACVYQLAELLNEHRAATVENVQRRQARTLAEREEEEDSDAENEVGGGGGAGGDRGKDTEGGPDVEDDDIPYNPKNLPLGWDGKVSFRFILVTNRLSKIRETIRLEFECLLLG